MKSKLNTTLVMGMFFLLFQTQSLAQIQDQAIIDQVLDGFHRAAANADWQAYFDLMSPAGVFIGTDAGERWTKDEFRAYAGNTAGWVYTPRSRTVTVSPQGDSAWFDEILQSASYGTSRGAGVLTKTSGGWKIALYALSFPIPNELADRITDEIKTFEKNRQ